MMEWAELAREHSFWSLKNHLSFQLRRAQSVNHRVAALEKQLVVFAPPAHLMAALLNRSQVQREMLVLLAKVEKSESVELVYVESVLYLVRHLGLRELQTRQSLLPS